jgi:tetratricopeptide (TPR) repeat protein
VRKPWAGLAALLAGGLAAYLTYQTTYSPSADLPRPAQYVDPAMCAFCHADIAKSYSATGMARTFGVMRAGSLLPAGAFAHEPSAQFFTIARDGGRNVLKRHVAGPVGSPAEEREAEVHYWIGSGNRGKGVIHKAASGRMLLLPVTYYTENGGHWAMNPGYDHARHCGFERVVDYRCLSCHTGYPGTDGPPSAWEFPESLPQGIDCQRCHGPGSAHLEAVRLGKSVQAIRSSIINPKALETERQREVCMQCHLETTSILLPAEIIHFNRGTFSYRPGEPLADWITAFDFAPQSGRENRVELVGSVYRLRQSACFQKSEAMTCTTCHNPHEVPRGPKAAAAYRAACLKCHSQPLSKSNHPQAAADCTGCHMPKRTPADAVHVQVTDHFIQRRPPAERARPSTEPIPEAYKGAIVTYHPPGEMTADRELYLAVAQVTQQANLVDGTTRLEKLIERHEPAHGEFYLQLGNAWLSQNQPAKARRWLQEAVRRMPADWRPLTLLATIDSDPVQLAKAIEIAPRETAPWIALGHLHAGNQRWSDAIAAYQNAIRIRPESADPYLRLGRAYASAGDGDSAERALRESLRLAPEIVQTRAELALLLAAKGDLPEARHHARLALRLDPAHQTARAAAAAVR